MTSIGSGELVRALAVKESIDALEIMIYPVAIGQGSTSFDGIAGPHDLARVGSRIFGIGKVLLTDFHRRLAG